MFNYNRINDLIAELQGKKNSPTIQQIADKIGVSKTQFDNYKSGRSMPTADMLEKMALFFGRDINYFFDSMPKRSEAEKKNVVSSPVEIYEPPTTVDECYRVMYAQQKEIAEQAKEIAEQAKEISELRIENERIKNANAQGMSARTG